MKNIAYMKEIFLFVVLNLMFSVTGKEKSPPIVVDGVEQSRRATEDISARTHRVLFSSRLQ
jgi:hypothetical protein